MEKNSESIDARQAILDSKLFFIVTGMLLFNLALSVIMLVELAAYAPFGDLTTPALARWGEAFSKMLLGAAGVHASWLLFRLSDRAPERTWFYMAAVWIVFLFWIAVSVIVSATSEAVPLSITLLHVLPWHTAIFFPALMAVVGSYLDRDAAARHFFTAGLGNRIGIVGLVKRFSVKRVSRRSL